MAILIGNALQFGLKVGLALVAVGGHNRAAPASLIICCYRGVSSLLFPLISRPSVRAKYQCFQLVDGFHDAERRCGSSETAAGR